MSTSSWHIGLDAGGTKTELLAHAADRSAPVQLFGDGANVQRVGAQQAARVFGDLVRDFLHGARGRRAASLCAGVAGAGRTRDQQTLQKLLCAELGDLCPPAVRVVHDAEIALEAAFEGESGVIVITGTGSIVLARTEDDGLLRAGGWGYLLGDDGSGFTLGRRGLRAVAAHYDGGPETHLQPLLAAHFDIHSNEDLIEAVYQKGLDIAEIAPLTMEAAADGDAVAEAAVTDVLEALGRQISWLLARARSVTPQIALLGGLTHEAYYRNRLEETLRGHFPEWTVGAPRHRPVVGALRLAQKAAAKGA